MTDEVKDLQEKAENLLRVNWSLHEQLAALQAENQRLQQEWSDWMRPKEENASGKWADKVAAEIVNWGANPYNTLWEIKQLSQRIAAALRAERERAIGIVMGGRNGQGVWQLEALELIEVNDKPRCQVLVKATPIAEAIRKDGG